MSAPSFDFGRSFVYSFEDPRDRMKIVIACLVYFGSLLTASCLVGLVGFAILWGYQRRVALQTVTGHDTPLPEWDRWSEDLAEGLKILVIRFLYGLPGVLMIVGSYIVFVIAIAAMGSSEPPAWGIILFVLTFLGGIPVMLLGMILGGLGTIRYIDTGEIGSAFRFGELYRFVRDNLGALLLTLLVGIAASFVANLVGLLLLVIGSYFTPGWTYLVTGQAMGQVIRAHRIRTANVASSHFE